MKTLLEYADYLKRRMMLNPRSFIIYCILRTLVIITMVRQFMLGNYESVWICALSLIMFMVPSFLEDKLMIKFPGIFEAIIYIFIYAAEILGEVNNFYVSLPGWDTMLHTANGFLCAAIGFSLVYVLNNSSAKIELSPFYLALVAFCFSMTIGILWEFAECFADMFLGSDAQKDFIIQKFQSVTLDPTNSQIPIAVKDITETVIRTASGEEIVIEGGYLDIGILDTMKDLFVNFIGATVFSVFGYIYVIQQNTQKTLFARIAGSLMLRRRHKEDVPREIPEDVKEQLRKQPHILTISEFNRMLEERDSR